MNKHPTVALVGAGHAHLYVAARAETLRQCGARVVLIEPSWFWYSGLATGMLGGMYGPADDQVDPRPLVEQHGGEFIRDRVEGVDSMARTLHLASGHTLAYDYLSLNVGSRVNTDTIPGMAEDPTVWSVKPISELWRLRQHLEARGNTAPPLQVTVIGGGPTGAEVAANLAALARRSGMDIHIALITAAGRLLPRAPAGAARKLQRKLTAMGVAVRASTRVVRRGVGHLRDDNGLTHAADRVVMATGLKASRLVHTTALPCDGTRGLRVTPELHSIQDPRVFAAGDCAAMDGHDLPKLGVFGVRQAAFVHTNLQASLSGRPLHTYRPQKRYLAVLNLGDGTALSTRGRWWWNGRSSMWLKNRIDRKFVAGYRTGDAGAQ